MRRDEIREALAAASARAGEYVELTDAEKAFIADKSPGNDETAGWEYALLHRAVGMVVRDRMAQAWDECQHAYFRTDEHPVVNPYRAGGAA